MSKISVLLVEDSPDDARLIERILTRHIANISLTCVDDLDTFKAELKLHNYSLVITDLNVGDVNGFDFITYMRKNHIHKPIIMVTATNDKDYTMRALELQVDDYVSKSYRYLLQLPYIIFRVLNFPPSQMIEEAEGLDLQKISEEYTDIFGADREISFKLWLDGSFMSTNQNFDRLLDYDKRELGNMSLRELVDATSIVEFDHLCTEIKLGKKYNYAHLKLRDKFGKLVEIEAHIELEYSGNKIIASRWNIRDITNLQTVQKNFLDKYRKYASAFGFSRVPTLLINNSGSIFQINPVACRLLGYEADKILGVNLIDIIVPEYKDQFVKMYHQQMEDQLDRYETEIAFMVKGSQTKTCRVRFTIIRNDKKLPRMLLLEVIE